MAAPKGNQFWKSRRDLGCDGKKLSIDELLDKAQEYIDYCLSNPLKEVKAISYGGKCELVEVPKMRPFTLKGLYAHLGITNRTWSNWKEDPEYWKVIDRVENLIYVQQFEGAAAGLFNANIIARKLGLTDKKDVTSGGKPISTKEEVVLPEGKTLDDYVNGI